MRRLTSPQQVSKPEEEARIAESRKTTAEGELTALSEAKKKIESDIGILDNTKNGLIKGNEEIFIVTNSYKEKLEIAKNEFIEFTKRAQEYRQSFNESILVVKEEIKKLNTERDTINNRITNLEETESTLKTKINNLDIGLCTLKKQKQEIEDKIKALPSIEKLEEDILTRKNEIEGLIKEKSILGDSVVPIQDLILKRKDELASIETVISLSENELASIRNKKEEVSESIRNENEKLEERSKVISERTTIAALAERRVEEKTQYLLRLIEKAKSENLIKDFSIT